MHEQSQYGHAPDGMHQHGTAADDAGWLGAPATSRAPWPAPTHGAHVPGPAPMPEQAAQPHARFHYAGGMVVPGAPSRHPQQLSAQGGTIGAAMPDPAANDLLPMLHQHAGQAQQWAFPTPNGLQLVQPGTARQLVQGSAPQQPGMQQPMPEAVTAAIQAAGSRRRLRWETIVPAAAVALFLAAAGLFISDFDRITGRDVARDADRAVAASATRDAAAAAKDDTAEVVQQVHGLVQEGRFEDAANMLQPLLKGDDPDPKLVELHDRIGDAADRNAALLATVTKQRRAGAWSKLSGTLAELEQLRPLSPSLTKLKTTAANNVRIDRALRRATALDKRGRTTEAVRVLDAAIAAGPNRRLTALRTKLRSKQRTSDASGLRGGGGGGAAATSRPVTAPPTAGGNRPTTRPAASSVVKPPANVPAGALPQVPNVPNPVGPANGGAAAVGGGGGGQHCEEHDGVRHCH